jgi:hypothetical protein
MPMQNWNTSITIRYHSYESTESLQDSQTIEIPSLVEMCSISTNLAPCWMVEEGDSLRTRYNPPVLDETGLRPAQIRL